MSERVKKWTPGPWSRSRYHYPDRDIVRRTGPIDNDSRPGYRHICTVFDRDPAEKRANAQLIAAAPALVGALEQAVTSMLDSGYNPKSVVIRECERVLALAYGETQ